MNRLHCMGASLLASLACMTPSKADDLAYLGPPGTYSEQAADLYRGRVTGFDKTVALDTITKVVQAVVSGTSPRGVIPVVATSSGFAAESSRAMLAALDPGFRVVGEVNIPIDNDLMTKIGASLSGIKTVLSHPNALGEAASWLHAHVPDAKLQETKSTAAAAELVSKGDETMAAVAGPAAAKLYGLTLLAERIQDNKDNRTSFWAIVKAGPDFPETKPDRIVVNLDAPSGSRSFSDVVSALRRIGFSVTHVNSAPLPGKLFGYRYTIALASGKPVPMARVQETTTIAAREGHAIVLGAWRGMKS